METQMNKTRISLLLLAVCGVFFATAAGAPTVAAAGRCCRVTNLDQEGFVPQWG